MRGCRGMALVGLLLLAGCGELDEWAEAGPDSTADDAVEETTEDLRSGSRYAGLQFAKKLVTPHLLAPSSANFPWETIQSRVRYEGQDYLICVVTGAIDAQNAFGVKLRHSWEAVVVLDRAAGEWAPVLMKLSDQVVYGSVTRVENAIRADQGLKPLDSDTIIKRNFAQFHREAKPEAAESADDNEVAPTFPGAIPPIAPIPKTIPTFRTWTDDTGSHTVEAQFAGFISGTVKLRKRDGQDVKMPMERLSEEDQAWIRERGK